LLYYSIWQEAGSGHCPPEITFLGRLLMDGEITTMTVASSGRAGYNKD